MVMFVCMNAVKTSANQRKNVRAHQQMYPSVIWRSLLQSTNRILRHSRLSCVFKESESRATDFEDAANITIDITVDGASIIPQ